MIIFYIYLSLSVLCIVFFYYHTLLAFVVFFFFFFFKQKTAYEMRISDWSSDVCSSDLERKAEGRMHERRLHIDAQEHTEPDEVDPELEIGRASCRERVCQYV